MKRLKFLLLCLASLVTPFCLSLLLTYSAVAAEDTFSQKLVLAARAQVGVTKTYVADYVKLDYPLGDVSPDRGVCTDVVIRALRACGHDLQVLVHLDMKQNFSAYPKNWGLKTTDRNIDHRRVPNLITYFTRKGMRHPHSDDPKRFQPGDLVTCLVAQNLPHIMIVSNQRGPSGDFMVLHNIGAGAQEEDCLHRYPHTGHFRWK
jgi:uncharacterized protein YijF (DUF1287 family)